MLPFSSDDSGLPVALTPRMALRPATGWRGTAEVVRPRADVLGAAAGASAAVPLTLFAPAAPAVELEVRAAPQPSVLGEAAPAPAILEFEPEEAAVYVLFQTVETTDGVIYDCTLPLPGAAPSAGVLSGAPAVQPRLYFPISPIMMDTPPGGAPAGAVLGIEEAIGDIVFKRVLQVLRSPIDRALLAAVRGAEPEPRVLALRETLQPLAGFEAWRSLLPPGGPRRVLLLVHGFLSSTAGSGGVPLLRELACGYDALLAYDHPTISRDPLQNARDLLALVPDDLQLSVDLLAHSRGGLVARSLAELAEPDPRLALRRLITMGSPHAGTRLADPARWDRLISLGMTAASWLTSAAGVAGWVPKLLEYILKAAAQGVFDLPGVAAMTPGGGFLGRLNADGGPAPRPRYATVASTFGVTDVRQQGFRQALEALAAQTFMGAPNDLVVPTESMSAIDRPALLLPPDQQLKIDVNHFGYFSDARAVDFVGRQLAGG